MARKHFKRHILHLFILSVCMDMLMHTAVHAWQDSLRKVPSCYSVLLGIELKLSDLVASTVTHWAILLALKPAFRLTLVLLVIKNKTAGHVSIHCNPRSLKQEFKASLGCGRQMPSSGEGTEPDLRTEQQFIVHTPGNYFFIVTVVPLVDRFWKCTFMTRDLFHKCFPYCNLKLHNFLGAAYL